MFDTASLLLFAAASFALIITPGPAVLFNIARSIEQGRTAGLVSVLGIIIGSIVHVVLAALGLSAVLAQSPLAFDILKYLGGAYLIYLGIRTLAAPLAATDLQTIIPKSYQKLFSQGVIVAVLNPKTALFFFAFLPQFVDPNRGSAPLQIGLLGALFLSIALVSDSVYALLAGTASDYLASNVRMLTFQKYLSGIVYIGLGILTAVSAQIT